MQNRLYKRVVIGGIIISIVFVAIALYFVERRQFYKIGLNGEYGEITVLGDYVILGHYTSLLRPSDNYIRMHIRYDQSWLEYEITKDSLFFFDCFPEPISYKISKYRHIEEQNVDTIQFCFFESRNVEYRGIISAKGFGLYPRFLFRINDSTCIRQDYMQTFFWESPDRYCYYDTLAFTL